MPLRYKCLVLDHDDTVTDSTAELHWPAFLDVMDQLRPGLPKPTLEEYFRKNFDPGFLGYVVNELSFTPEELKQEFEIWQKWVSGHIPQVYPGMAEIIRRQLAEGGQIAVVSHSIADNIRRDYRANGLPVPELIFGWERPPEERKPNPWPVEQILQALNLERKDLLMIDDSGPGFQMAKNAGIDFAAAMWAYDVPEIRDFMQVNSRWCFRTPEELAHWLFEDKNTSKEFDA